jgi:hypothetical protein
MDLLVPGNGYRRRSVETPQPEKLDLFGIRKQRQHLSLK